MSISQLPSGSWRTQLRRQHFPIFDEVHPTREAAVAAEDAELAQRRGTTAAGPRMPLRDAIVSYQDSSTYIDLAPATVRGYNRAFVVLAQELGDYTLEFISSNLGVVTKFRARRRRTISTRTGKPLGADTVRIELAALSQVFAFCVEDGIFTHNPILGIVRKRGKKRERRLESDESVNLKLLAERATSEQHKLIARFLLTQLELYCRPGELAALRVADVRLAERDCIFRNTKNGHSRTVHMSPAAVELISAQLVESAVANSPYLFFTLNREGKHVPFNYAWPLKQLRTLKYVGGDFVAHAMRKEAVSSALESNMPAPTVQLMTGHQSLQALEEYKVKLRMSDNSRDAIDEHSNRQLLESDADLNNQLPPQLALARFQHAFAALPPDVQQQFLAAQPPTVKMRVPSK